MLTSLTNSFIDISGGLNQAAIDEWTNFIFNKMEERDDDDEDHNPEDYL